MGQDTSFSWVFHHVSKPQLGCGGSSGISGYTWRLLSASQVPALHVGLSFACVTLAQSGLRVELEIWIHHLPVCFWTNDHLCSLCNTSSLLQPVLLDQGCPHYGLFVNLSPCYRCS